MNNDISIKSNCSATCSLVTATNYWILRHVCNFLSVTLRIMVSCRCCCMQAGWCHIHQQVKAVIYIITLLGATTRRKEKVLRDLLSVKKWIAIQETSNRIHVSMHYAKDNGVVPLLLYAGWLMSYPPTSKSCNIHNYNIRCDNKTEGKSPSWSSIR